MSNKNIKFFRSNHLNPLNPLLLACKLLLSSSFILFFYSGCAVGPLVNGTSARSLNKGHYRLDSSLVVYPDSSGDSMNFTPVVRFLYGLNRSWDLGLQTELKTVTLSSKYSFMDSQKADGLSLAGIGGIVFAGSELSYFVGGIASYLYRGIEPYIACRYNLVNYDREFFDGSFFFRSPDLHFSFVSFHGGLLYWWTPVVAWGGELVAWSPDSLPTNRNVMVSFQISFLF